MLQRLFHLAVNSTDLDRSVAFYTRLGFQIVSDRTVVNEKVKEAFAGQRAELLFTNLSTEQENRLREAFSE